jgi:crotonobetaine/carnitine-CoA ligase
MTEIMDNTTIAEAFAAAVAAHADRPFLAVPAHEGRAYLPAASRSATARRAGRSRRWRRAIGRRATASAIASRRSWRTGPEHVLHTLALNSLGVCCVPINPDYRAAEIAYLIDHSEPDLVLTLDSRRASIEAALAESGHRPSRFRVGALRRYPGAGVATGARFKPRPRDAGQHPLHLGHDRPAQGLRPVARLRSGVRRLVRRARRRGRPAPGEDRIYNPLPLYHANAGVVSLMGAILTGNCQIQPDRFHAQHWWREVPRPAPPSSTISASSRRCC